MTLGYTKSALDSLSKLPKPVRKAFYKQVGFLVRDL
jgi:mRNA-degrading endonuclease RelE of RelBE toxin-antitoxin system